MNMDRKTMKSYYVWMRMFLICAETYFIEVVVLRSKPFPRSRHSVLREIGDKMYKIFIEYSLETGVWPRGMKAQARMRGYDV